MFYEPHNEADATKVVTSHKDCAHAASMLSARYPHLLTAHRICCPWLVRVCHRRPKATPRLKANGMNTTKRPKTDPPESVHKGDPAATNNQQHPKINDRPFIHVIHAVMSNTTVLIVIEEIIVIKAIVGWRPR